MESDGGWDEHVDLCGVALGEEESRVDRKDCFEQDIAVVAGIRDTDDG